MAEICLNSNIPALIQQGVGMGLISIFLTAIIFIYTTGEKEMQSWDRSVILDKVINTTDFFVYLGLIFLPSFFWDLCGWYQVSILSLAAIGVIYLFCFPLRNIYRWITDLEGAGDLFHLPPGYREQLREKFLAEATDDHRAKIWSMTWGKKTDPGRETRLMSIFFRQVNEMARTHDWKRLRDYLQTYNASRSNREIKHWHTTRIAFDRLLEVAHEEYNAINSSDANHEYIYLGNLIDDLLSFYISTSLKSGASFIIFDSLKSYLAEKEPEYVEYFIGRIHQTLFESIVGSPQNYTIWHHHFPNEWKITKKNLEENKIARAMFRFYIEWIQSRTRTDEEWDKPLDEISRELFPELDPSWWAELMTYMIRPWGDSRIISLLEAGPNFGFIGRSFGGVNLSTEELQRGMAETMRSGQENTINFFAKHFSIPKKEVEDCIVELERFEPTDEKLGLRKGKLLEIFRALLNKLNAPA
jgi:hypothetical protein